MGEVIAPDEATNKTLFSAADANENGKVMLPELACLFLEPLPPPKNP
jgi:hypothetical protein|tara:strand:- start:58 stop:198 length:141 start_codon:yes stop_codon:yes gene_type:complete